MKKLFLSIIGIWLSFAAFGQGTVFTASSNAIGDTVEMTARSIVPTTLEVDWGNGERLSYQVDSAITKMTGCISGGGKITVYGNAEDIWVFVTCFGLGNNELASIDLSKNLRLAELTLAGNPMSSVDVSMLSELRYFVVSWMENMKSVDVSKNQKLENLYVNGTQLESLDVSHNPDLWDLQCMSCGLESLDVSHNPKMRQIMCENNNLTTLDISACPNLVYLRCYNNYLTIGTLPLFHPIVSTSYLYAPQKPLPMPDTLGGIDFSAGYDCEGYISQYTWRTEDGQTLINGLDYTMNEGIINFLTPGLKVSGQIENGFFPELTGVDACQTEFFITEIGHVANETVRLEGTEAYASRGMLCMESGKPVDVEIYVMNGQRLHSLILDGKAEWQVPSTGLYLVKMQAGVASVTHKVMVLK